ncbi:MAG: hypothetical protein LAP85_28570 [Acidobacteriia bacterium]|nr:hypothetical protein [Terriglobia bacterium]
MSSNNFGGLDRDLLQRPVGDHPLSIVPIVCTKCYFAGTEQDFKKPGQIDPALKKQILAGKKLVPAIPIKRGMTSNQVPPWVKWDLICQLHQLKHGDDERLGDLELAAAWSVRVSRRYYELLGDDLMKSLQEWGAKEVKVPPSVENGNRADLEIKEAHRLLGSIDSADATSAPLVGLTALILFCDHGENLDAENVLQRLRPLLSVQLFAKLDTFVRESTAIETRFQERAIECYERILGNETDEGKRAVHLYLLGELYRRTRKWDVAIAYFDRALKTKALNTLLTGWADQQKELTLRQSTAAGK